MNNGQTPKELTVDINELVNNVAAWWNPMSGYDKNYYVKLYEGGTVPVASLTEGAIIRLYLKVFENLNHFEALQKYHKIINQ